MGNYISNNTVLLSAKRLLMRYNIENRAFKELDRQAIRPVVAPKHDADIVDYHKSLSGMTISQFLMIFVVVRAFNEFSNAFLSRQKTKFTKTR